MFRYKERKQDLKFDYLVISCLLGTRKSYNIFQLFSRLIDFFFLVATEKDTLENSENRVGSHSDLNIHFMTLPSF